MGETASGSGSQGIQEDPVVDILKRRVAFSEIAADRFWDLPRTQQRLALMLIGELASDHSSGVSHSDSNNPFLRSSRFAPTLKSKSKFGVKVLFSTFSDQVEIAWIECDPTPPADGAPQMVAAGAFGSAAGQEDSWSLFIRARRAWRYLQRQLGIGKAPPLALSRLDAGGIGTWLRHRARSGRTPTASASTLSLERCYCCAS
jgi:hypothetical protein